MLYEVPLPELSGHPSGALGFPSPPGTSRDAARHLLEPPGHKTTRSPKSPKLKAGGKPSTRLPPGKLVEHFETKYPRPPASSLQPPALCLQPSACSRQSPALRPGHAPEAQKTTRLDRKMPIRKSSSRPLPELSGHHAGALGFL